MCLFLYDDDPEPEERVPAGPLCVPVRPGPGGAALRLFRTPLGSRTAVGFTSPALLAATLGTGQPWIVLSEPALRAMAEPLGVARLTLTAPSIRPAVEDRSAAPLGATGTTIRAA
ncbi:SAV_915 family protein [Streptomyces sp. NPDC006208]|uniref:SAV_915 family protein n=1 Tax=Streptomyces sp. NPDC006208 TaxID=3156734 RepID=UPI0033A3BF3A